MMALARSFGALGADNRDYGRSSAQASRFVGDSREIIGGPARRERPLRRRPRALPGATSAAEWKELAPRPASSLPGTGHRAGPRSPEQEQAPSTNPSSSRTRRAEDYPHAAITNHG